MRQPRMSCCDQAGLMPVEQALKQLLTDALPVTETEQVPLAEALGRILAEDVQSTLDVPPADNSAMDGYALNLADLAEIEGQSVLPISQRIPAGVAPLPLQTGTAARIFTGASIPANANAVVMQEQCEERDGSVLLPAGIRAGQNIRPRGQDIAAGAVVLEQGMRLKPQDLGLLASVGIARVTVYRRLKVAILSTGDELVEPGNELVEGQIYNSNRYTLIGLLNSLGIERVDLGRVQDTPEATLAALQQASVTADAIISTGGVSVGEEDHIKAAVEQLGQLKLWRLAIKPGKPLAYGRVGDKPFIGLPGNPAAAFITFCIVARPYLLAMQGATDSRVETVPVTAGFSVAKPGKRQEYYRCRLELDARGQCHAVKYPNQSSGVLSSTSWADGLVIIPIGKVIAEGETVEYLPLAKLIA